MSLLSFCIFISSKDIFFCCDSFVGAGGTEGQKRQKVLLDFMSPKIKKLLFLMCLLSFCIYTIQAKLLCLLYPLNPCGSNACLKTWVADA